MKLAFCIFKYFPYGGVQRDMMRVVSSALSHGHEVDIYTMSWKGKLPLGAEVKILPIKALTNHGRANAFSKKIATMPHDNYDLVVGFNKMAGLDFCFIGDVCLKTKMEKQSFCRLLPRYRTYLQLEEAVFGVTSSTRIMLLTPQQKKEYQVAYHTNDERIKLLPAGLEYREPPFREIKEKNLQLLFVATKFFNKGLDRAIKALASLSRQDITLKVIGGDDPTPFQKLVKQLHLDDRVQFLGSQDNLFEHMIAADMLIHPARVEAAGMVLLEAIIAGLPILTTENCGYAFHVEKAEAGILLPIPFQQADCNQALEKMLNKNKRLEQHTNALKYAKIANFYQMGEEAVKWVELK